jgi:PIN domain nuclease of toxin-antitoxin system
MAAGINYLLDASADLDGEFSREIGRLKSLLRRVSLADCACLALAVRLGGEVVTSDHHELDAVVPRNVCPIRFIR